MPELCFVLMPYENSRRDRESTSLNFDRLYDDLIAPAVRAAGLKPVRADQELQGGIFHKIMFERLATCKYAVADLSLPNPNVFYELGIRHALRPWSTVLMFQEDLRLPLDVALDAAMTYPARVLDDHRLLSEARRQLQSRLETAEVQQTDSPVFQLVAGLPTPEIDHRRADVLVESALRDDKVAQRVVDAEHDGPEALTALRAEIGDLGHVSPEVVSALVMSFRAQERWSDMIDTITSADPDFATVWVIQEQHALALGRVGEFRRATQILERLIAQRPNSETYGLLGGVYRRQHRKEASEGRTGRYLQGLYDKAQDAYRRGFECDWRDPYPGVNAVVLAALINLNQTLSEPLFGAVRYAVERRLTGVNPEYWDYACGLQLAVVAGDTERADGHLAKLLVRMDQDFEKTSTLETLRELRVVSEEHGNQGWHDELVAEVESK